jgi:hypothetical protein
VGLIQWLTRVASSRPHVLIAEAPGAFHHRVALERALGQVGWQRADSAADADVLAVVGEPGEQLTAIVEQAWAQMSEPRARIEVGADTDLAATLHAAREALSDRSTQACAARERSGGAAGGGEHKGHEDHEDRSDDESHDEHGDHGGHDEHDEHGGHESHGDHSEHDSHDHGGHDHGGMSPDGIPLAEGADDRDGLEMDVLHLPLGPVLAHWPAGLVVRLSLHGDVVADAEVEQLPAAGVPRTVDDASTRAARLLDAAASVLALAGLPAQAAHARELRDGCLDGEPDADAVARLGKRVQRHRILRWLLSGLSNGRLNKDGPSSALGGGETLHDRLVGLFERAKAELDEQPHSGTTQEATTSTNGPLSIDEAPGIHSLPDLVRGHELAAVRLLIAAAAPDLLDLTGGAGEPYQEAAHG